jgi:hypothetical protein
MAESPTRAPEADVPQFTDQPTDFVFVPADEDFEPLLSPTQSPAPAGVAFGTLAPTADSLTIT